MQNIIDPKQINRIETKRSPLQKHPLRLRVPLTVLPFQQIEHSDLQHMLNIKTMRLNNEIRTNERKVRDKKFEIENTAFIEIEDKWKIKA